MSRRVNHFAFAISAQSAEEQFVGFVDCLRYDQARVVESDANLIILRSVTPPTEGRWRSFGIPVIVVDAFREDDIPDVRYVREQAMPKLAVSPVPEPSVFVDMNDPKEQQKFFEEQMAALEALARKKEAGDA